MRDLLIILAIGAGTYALRAAFLIVPARAGRTTRLARLLPHVGPAVLAAIILPALLAPRGHISVSETVPALLAAVLAWLLWRRTARLPVALFGGLALWWLGVWAIGVL